MKWNKTKDKPIPTSSASMVRILYAYDHLISGGVHAGFALHGHVYTEHGLRIETPAYWAPMPLHPEKEPSNE